MDVYEPAEDSFLLYDTINKEVKKKVGSALDMGTGSGFLAKLLLKKADKVVACDIDPEALKHARKDAKGAEFVLTDLFRNVKGKHDLIVFNPPYLPKDQWRFGKDVQTIGGKQGYETVVRFVKQLKKYLNPGGKCLLLISSLTTPRKVEEHISESGLSFRIVNKRKLFFETLFVYRIWV
jgi:release factor glutamine methyltransferase